MKLKYILTALTCGLLALLPRVSVCAQEDVVITQNGMAVDSFQGIEANYIMGTGNSNTGAYCCAGYVIKFYKELYDVDTYNINTVWGKPTVVKEGHEVWLEEVDIPEPGDMMQSLTYSHVGIVKEVLEDKVILIEQNYKWSKNGQTVATVDREIGFDEAHFYRLYIDGEEKHFGKEPEETSETFSSLPYVSGEDITSMKGILGSDAQ